MCVSVAVLSDLYVCTFLMNFTMCTKIGDNYGNIMVEARERSSIGPKLK